MQNSPKSTKYQFSKTSNDKELIRLSYLIVYIHIVVKHHYLS